MTDQTPVATGHPDSPEPSKGAVAADKPQYRCVPPKLPAGATFQPSVAATDKVNEKGQRLYEVNTRVNQLRRRMNELRRQGYTTKQIKEIERRERKEIEKQLRHERLPRVQCPACQYEQPAAAHCESCGADMRPAA